MSNLTIALIALGKISVGEKIKLDSESTGMANEITSLESTEPLVNDSNVS